MPLKELQAAVEGLLFLAAEGPEEELFTVSAGGEEVAVANPNPNPSPSPIALTLTLTRWSCCCRRV